MSYNIGQLLSKHISRLYTCGLSADQQALWHELLEHDGQGHTRDDRECQDEAAELTGVAQALTRLTARLQSNQASALVTAESGETVGQHDRRRSMRKICCHMSMSDCAPYTAQCTLHL